jgi:hypothetical protein
LAVWGRPRIDDWAARMGPTNVTVIGKIFESASIEEAGFDPALAVLRLSRRFSRPELKRPPRWRCRDPFDLLGMRT